MPIADRTVPATLSHDERWPPPASRCLGRHAETLHMDSDRRQAQCRARPVPESTLAHRPLPHHAWTYHPAAPLWAAYSRSISTSSTTISPSSPVKEHASSSLYPHSVALLRRWSVPQGARDRVQINTTPQEVPNPVPFEEDTGNASYDPHAVNRWWRVVTSTSRVMSEHRAWFRGKASPVHWFWGSFDLTATRHNGELATRRQAATSTGSRKMRRTGPVDSGPATVRSTIRAFYAYMYPQPDGLAAGDVRAGGGILERGDA